MGAECSCKITPSKGICTWLAMGFPGTTTLPDNKSRFLVNFAKGSGEKEIHQGPRRTLGLSTKGTQVQEDQEIMFPSFGLSVEHESMPDLKLPYRIEPLVEATAMRPFRVDPSGGDGRGRAKLCAGGTPALPGSRHPMTSSHSGHEIAEALWFRLSLKQVHLSSCLFVFIRVHSWFVFINDRLFFLERSARQGGGRTYLKQPRRRMAGDRFKVKRE